MNDWPVMKDTIIRRFPSQDRIDIRNELEAQAQLVGGLADAVIVWMCYFAQRQERENIIDQLQDLLEKSEKNTDPAIEVKMMNILSALRGDKGE